ncbi:MAG TPA: aldehyde ferredoxin oxidoreductase family protein [Symbiobacteriaceae bacterium]|nr:aldehyde ferredoxin oxidoreductase family protein [Symbiobacteriaceae bacterium]
MRGGYHGRILYVDLSTSAWWVEQLAEEDARCFLGGSGLGARYLWEMTNAATDPLGPDNPLLMLAGPLTATLAPTSGRYCVVTRSPLTGLWGEANAGGSWGAELRRAGYDGLIVLGKAARPTYIWIADDHVELRSADHLWGLDTYEVDETLRTQLDPKLQVLCIGPAGERQSRIAGLFSDGRDGRCAGRCGVGAVAGSKLLKAVAVHGTGTVPVADPDAFKKAVRERLPEVVKGTKRLKDFGTAGLSVPMELLGDMVIRNWRDGRWAEGAERISGERMAETILTGRYYCDGCPIGCGRDVEVKEGPYQGVKGGGPEFETISLLGANVLVDDLEAISYANELCNRYGVDTIEMGAALGFAFECFEHGLITAEDTGGVALEWGNAAAMVELVRLIAERRLVGAVLCNGLVPAAEAIGGLAPEFAMHTKGLALPAHDPRGFASIAVGYATSNRGACHMNAYSHAYERNLALPDLGFPQTLDRFSPERKGELVARAQDFMALYDSLSLCKFTKSGGVTPRTLAAWTSLVTGWDLSFEEFMAAGERSFTLKRMYNVRLGVSRKDDTIPARILSQRRGTGSAATHLPALGTMLADYYEVRGWSPEGIPTRQTLERLGLADLVGSQMGEMTRSRR